MTDVGKYNKNQDDYKKLVDDMSSKYSKGVALPPEYASFIEEDLGRLLIRLARYKFIAKHLKQSDNVLELGCGSGLGSIYFSQNSNSVVGIDAKKSEIEDANKINTRSNIDFICQDFFTYNFNKKFEAVINLDVIEHLQEKDGEKLIKMMSNLTSKYGMAIIGTPSFYSWPHQGPLSQASHVKCYKLEELEELIGKYFNRTLSFSMNDEIVHTGHHKMAWYYFVIGFYPKYKSE